MFESILDVQGPVQLPVLRAPVPLPPLLHQRHPLLETKQRNRKERSKQEEEKKKG